ncbi:hypothetical protein [Sphingobium olei]|uniref:hypothetical protein n=1 Tax=Sphingobium olei TaxID=420955 RepID=UPI003D247B05
MGWLSFLKNVGAGTAQRNIAVEIDAKARRVKGRDLQTDVLWASARALIFKSSMRPPAPAADPVTFALAVIIRPSPARS